MADATVFIIASKPFQTFGYVNGIKLSYFKWKTILFDSFAGPIYRKVKSIFIR